MQFEGYVDAARPLAALYSHASTDADAEQIFRELHATMRQEGIELKLNPFLPSQDVHIAMARLQVSALVLYCTTASLTSAAVETELTTARGRGMPVGVVAQPNGPLPPPDLARRIVCRLSTDHSVRKTSIACLARELADRARTHWALERLAKPDVDVDEREAGAKWLCERDHQILAEFLPAVAALHLGEREDPNVGYWLATALGRTGLAEARAYLDGWRAAAKTANAWGAGHPRHLRAIDEAILSLPTQT